MKKFSAIVLAVVMVLSMTGCFGINRNNNSNNKYSEIKWPNSELASLLPVPESLIGEIDLETASSFWVTIANVSKQQFNDYVEDCKNCGFTEDYRNYDDWYIAKNKDGYRVSITYTERNKEMSINLSSPSKSKDDNSTSESSESSDDDSDNSGDTSSDNSSEDSGSSDTSSSTPEESSDNKSDSVLGNIIRPDIKEAIDSYEAFMDEYIAFMKKYRNSDDPFAMLGDYLKYLEKLNEVNEKFDAIQDKELTDAEALYYSEVSLRVSKKLLDSID